MKMRDILKSHAETSGHCSHHRWCFSDLCGLDGGRLFFGEKGIVVDRNGGYPRRNRCAGGNFHVNGHGRNACGCPYVGDSSRWSLSYDNS